MTKHPIPTSDCDLIACERDHWKEVCEELVTALKEARAVLDVTVMADDSDGTPSEDQSALEKVRKLSDDALTKAGS